MSAGYLRIATAVPRVKVGDVTHNTQQIESLMVKAQGLGVDVVCFPELSLTGYSCQDLFGQQLLLDEAEQALVKLLELSRNLQLTTIVGLPYEHRGALFNCAAIVQGGKLQGLVPKTFLPNHQEFYEQRWFTSASQLEPEEFVHFCGSHVPFSAQLLFCINQAKFGVEICEDLWAPIPPSSFLALEGAHVVFNLSASNDIVGKHDYVRQLVAGQSARCMCAYAYTSAGFGESTQDLVFGGKALIAENGTIIGEAARFEQEAQILVKDIDIEHLRAERRQNTTFAQSLQYKQKGERYIEVQIEQHEYGLRREQLLRPVNPLPFVPSTEEFDARCQEILDIQSLGLMTRVAHTKAKTVVLGISGGLDSTLALLVCVQAFDKLGLSRRGIVGVTMPGFGTTNRTYTNAVNLMKSLGITSREISIKDAVLQHFKDIQHDANVHDTTYENSQARERTQILMDVANQMDGFVVGTGDLSELALGWATYNGDHMSMYGVNSAIPKTLVRHLVYWVAQNSTDAESRNTLLDILETPISPELLPMDAEGNIAQITEELVGPYELHDFFLYHFLRYQSRPSKIYAQACSSFDGQEGRPFYDERTIGYWLEKFYRRFFSQQFKRSCMPDGPKVGRCSLSPRGDWRMPSDACASEWIAECQQLNAPS
ncbi:MAG: NAD(+) synthase [Bacteroidales bacterium]|nr:NAD(+) synthase [Bacteroidales bacterium]